MTDASLSASARPRLIRGVVSLAVVLGLIAAAGWVATGGFTANLPPIQLHPHMPDPRLLAAAPVAIQLHLAAAMAAFFLGLAQFVLPKGTGLHRTIGWTWVVLIGTAAVSSLFIRQVNNGAFSFIHILSGWTLVVLPMAIYAARRGDIARHRGRMTGLFIGGLLVAGLLAFAPGRLMWRLFLGD